MEDSNIKKVEKNLEDNADLISTEKIENFAFATKIFDEELNLTKEALFSNPKSYSAWHHRFWAFKNHPQADLQKELALCEKALSYDCRNFHCWDHRRSVSKLANLTNEDELEFSNKLITINPSNYSAWHYRGTLLPKVRPDKEVPEGLEAYKMPISVQCLKEEYEVIF